jgi:tetratricopeptide (TPR) repeat protein
MQTVWVARLLGVVVALTAVQAGAQEDQRVASAHTLALKSRYQASIALYDSVLASDPKNWEAARQRAQVVAWSGKLADAESDYRALVTVGAGPDAEKGLAQVVAWRGRLHESEAMYRGVVARDSMDTEAWTGLAQVLQWEGRPRDAEAAIQRGLAAHPEDDDAQAQWRAIRPLVSPAVRPSASSAGDSEHNTSVLTTIEADALPPWSGRVSVTGSFRDAWRSLTHGTSSSGQLGATWNTPGERLTMQGSVGVAATDGTDVASRSVTMLVGSAHVGTRIGSALTLGAGVSAQPFDETAALIARGIRQSSVGGDLAVLFHGEEGPHLDASGAYVGVGGGQMDDERTEGSIYVWSAAHGIAVGAGAHGYGYVRSDLVDGYFTPASFILGEGVVRWSTNVASGWNGSAEVGAGAQRIALFGQNASIKPAERIQGSVSYRVAPGIDYGISAGYTVAASPVAPTATAASNYRGYELGVFARLIP